MGEGNMLVLILKWIPWLFTGATSVVSKLIYDKYKDIKEKVKSHEDKIELNEREIVRLDLKITELQGEKIGRPEFERVVGEFKTEVKEEFNNFRREFREQSREDRDYRDKQFDILAAMMRDLSKR